MRPWRQIFAVAATENFKPYKAETGQTIPNHAKFTGDEIPKTGDPAKIELNAWRSGDSKFRSYKDSEDKDQYTSLVVNDHGRAESATGIGNLYPINKQARSSYAWQLASSKLEDFKRYCIEAIDEIEPEHAVEITTDQAQLNLNKIKEKIQNAEGVDAIESAIVPEFDLYYFTMLLKGFVETKESSLKRQSWRNFRQVDYNSDIERGWGWENSNKIRKENVVKVKDLYYYFVKPIRVSQMVAGQIYGDSYKKFNSGYDVIIFNGFTDMDDKYGNSNIVKFKSAKELLTAYGVRSWKALEAKQKELAKERYAADDYGHESYMSATDLETKDSGAWYYLFEGRWVRGSGAEPLTFWEVEEVSASNVEAGLKTKSWKVIPDITPTQRRAILMTGRIDHKILDNYYNMDLSNWVEFNMPGLGRVLIAADVFRYIIAVQEGDDVNQYEVSYEDLASEGVNPYDFQAVVEHRVINDGSIDYSNEGTTLDELIEDGGESVVKISKQLDSIKKKSWQELESAETIAQDTMNAFAYDSYGWKYWLKLTQFFLDWGLTGVEVEWILRSKWVRWLRDRAEFDVRDVGFARNFREVLTEAESDKDNILRDATKSVKESSLKNTRSQMSKCRDWRGLLKKAEVSFNQKPDGTVSIDVTTPQEPLPKADEEVAEMKADEEQPVQPAKSTKDAQLKSKVSWADIGNDQGDTLRVKKRVRTVKDFEGEELQDLSEKDLHILAQAIMAKHSPEEVVPEDVVDFLADHNIKWHSDIPDIYGADDFWNDFFLMQFSALSPNKKVFSWRKMFKKAEVSFNQKPDGTVTIDVTNPPIPQPHQTPVQTEPQATSVPETNEKQQKTEKPVKESLLSRTIGRIKGITGKHAANKVAWQDFRLSLDDIAVGDKVRVDPQELDEVMNYYDTTNAGSTFNLNDYYEHTPNKAAEVRKLFETVISNEFGYVMKKLFTENSVLVNFTGNYGDILIPMPVTALKKVSEKAKNPPVDLPNVDNPENLINPELGPAQASVKQWIIKKANGFALVGRECDERCGIFIVKYPEHGTLIKSASLQDVPEKAIQKEIQSKNGHTFDELISRGVWETKFDNYVKLQE